MIDGELVKEEMDNEGFCSASACQWKKRENQGNFARKNLTKIIR